jgi:glycosyltransferase involved in cell wall biosynthesis/O-antigen ligase
MLGLLTADDPKLGLGVLAVCAYASLALVGFAAMFAAWTLSFFIPFFGVGNVLLKTGLVLTTISLFIAWTRNAQSMRAHVRMAAPFLLIALLFLAWLAASTLWAPETHSAISELWKYGISVGIFAALIVAIDAKRHVRLIVAAFVVGALITAICGLLGISGGHVNSLPSESRIQGGIGDPNVLAAAVLAAIVLAGGLMAGTRRGTTKLLLLGAIVVFALTAAGTESRGGAIAVIVVLVAALVFMRERRGSVIAVAIGGLAAAGTWLALSPGSLHRLTNFSDHGNGRYELWRIAWEMAASHPLQGVGLENFIPLAPTYVLRPGALTFVHLITEKPVVVHNTYLQFLAETGVVGLLLFLTLVSLSLVASLKAASIYERLGDSSFAQLCRCIFLAAIALLAADFFISSGVDYKLWTVLGLGPAAFVLARRASEVKMDQVDLLPQQGGGETRPAMSPRVAVIIPCFNDGATVEAALASLQGQESHEVVVVDDGSDDPETLEVLARLRATGRRVIRQENGGLSAARMRGVTETTAPYIQPLDADDMLAPGALQRLADVLDLEPGLGMAWGDQQTFGEVEWVQRRAETLDPWAITYANRLTEGLIRREALLDAGGWVLAIGYEDWDLYMGLAEKGWRGQRVDSITYLYRISSSRMLSTARLHHDRLYGQMRERHAALFRERRANWIRSSAPIATRLLLPVVARLPISEFGRHRIALFISEPMNGIRVRLSRLKKRRAANRRDRG